MQQAAAPSSALSVHGPGESLASSLGLRNGVHATLRVSTSSELRQSQAVRHSQRRPGATYLSLPAYVASVQGGSTMFKDFGRRLQRDVQRAVDARQPPGGNAPVEVCNM